MSLSGAQVLVIGGGEFMGPPTVSALLAEKANVTVLNRGSAEPPPAVHHIKCDRRTSAFPKFLRETKDRWDLVVDFIAMSPADVKPIVQELATNCSAARDLKYIVISTDSVYMASDPAHRKWSQSGRILESSDLRPLDPAVAAERHRADEYGSNKLAMEEFLRAEGGGLEWTALRLPDVLGPNDNTGRQSRLLCALASGEAIGGCIASWWDNPCWQQADGAVHRISLVYSKDVGTAIVAAFNAGSATAGKSINVASAEAPTWVEFLSVVASNLGTVAPEIDPEAPSGLVSVDVGTLDISAARRLLVGWEPTPLHRWVAATVRWARTKDAALLAAQGFGAHGLKAPQGGLLVEWSPTEEGFFCDKCGLQVEAGTKLYGCRIENFDLVRRKRSIIRGVGSVLILRCALQCENCYKSAAAAFSNTCDADGSSL
eukprot:SAG31_NODE_455_length_15433_cov_4.248728_9_plen_430_part_00